MISKAEFDRQFEEYHRRNARKRPHLVAWNPVGEAQLREIEQATGIELPPGFHSFLTSYGYGGFYFATIFCPLLERPPGLLYTMWEYHTWPQFDADYLPISSNGDELWAGFKVTNGMCGERLFNYDVDESVYTDEYDCIWDFLAEVALVDLDRGR